MASIKPLGDRVLVKADVAENGNKIEMTVKEGDKVLYGKYAGTEVSVDGNEYLIMRESDIVGILA